MTFVGRKAEILRAIVDDYIHSAEPIASKNLVKEHSLSLSSATIRNEMARLEKEGYLEQPHTSSGRIPSDKGYRAYVDYLINEPLKEDLSLTNFQTLAKKEIRNLSTWIKESAQVLAFETGYTSIAISPHCSTSVLRQIKLLFLEPGKALILIVLAQGLVKDHLAYIPHILGKEELTLITEAIESGLSGLSLAEINFVTVESCVDNIEIPDMILKQVLTEAYVAIKQAENLETYIEGSHNLLAHKEFQETNKFKNLMDTLTKDGLLAGYLNDANRDNQEKTQYMIRIGQEINVPGMQDCSFVTTTYQCGPQLWGTIGIVGPKRMDYKKVIKTIKLVRHIINKQSDSNSQSNNDKLYLSEGDKNETTI